MALGDLERSVMDLLWDHPGPHTANEVRDTLAGDLAVTTVLTVLSRLEKKGLVQRDGGRRPHRYGPHAPTPPSSMAQRPDSVRPPWGRGQSGRR